MILKGSEETIRAAYDKWAEQGVDQDLTAPNGTTYGHVQTTLGEPVSVTGPGTYFGRAQRTLTFEPTTEKGWWFHRRDLKDSLPIQVSVRNVWNTKRSIVLLSGSPHNYMRMVEHIVALKVGMGLDNVIIGVDSGDPPLFDRSSMDLVEAVERAGIVKQGEPAHYFTVKEPVTLSHGNGGFLTFLPAENGSRDVRVDCAIDFPTAIGKQRVKFVVNRSSFHHGAAARTNTSFWMMLYCRTIGMIFADTRNLGYTKRNILVAGPKRYYNEPKLPHNGKSLEAVWHRSTLDLLAAVALMEKGRFAGSIISYKSGHTLDVQMVLELYTRDLLEPC
jgi:UDP-3-O-acyl-N-acetylglucosamine deacetylase